LGRILLERRRGAEAEAHLRDSLAIWEARRPDDWNRFDTQSLLGSSLLGQKKFAEAEPLLLSGYQGMRARDAKLPASKKFYVTESGERIVRLYEGWGRTDEALAWRAKLTPLPAPAKHDPGACGPTRDRFEITEVGSNVSA
jgi:eukaryotic-like serine/threonine-protein kinase